MPSPDDERFESYLRQFRPVAPPPLQAEMPPWTHRNWLLAAASLAAAVVLIVVAFSLLTRSNRSSARGETIRTAAPLTLRRANALLITAPSYKAAIDKLAFQPSTDASSQGKTSALAVLSKEKSRL